MERGVGEMVVEENDMGEENVVVIEKERVNIGRCEIRKENDEIVKIIVREEKIEMKGIVKEGLEIKRRID